MIVKCRSLFMACGYGKNKADIVGERGGYMKFDERSFQ